MKLEKEDYEQLKAKLEEAIEIIDKFWIDPDYSSEQEDRRWMKKMLQIDLEHMRRYFRFRN